jgi:hypothetical protein
MFGGCSAECRDAEYPPLGWQSSCRLADTGGWIAVFGSKKAPLGFKTSLATQRLGVHLPGNPHLSRRPEPYLLQSSIRCSGTSAFSRTSSGMISSGVSSRSASYTFSSVFIFM